MTGLICALYVCKNVMTKYLLFVCDRYFTLKISYNMYYFIYVRLIYI